MHSDSHSHSDNHSDKPRPDEIIDGHCHLASAHCLPDAFFRGIAANMVVRMQAENVPADINVVTAMLKSQHTDHQGDELVAQMDAAGIHSTVLLAADFTYALKSDYSIEAIMQQHFAAAERHPGRFHIFAGIDPRRGKNALGQSAVQAFAAQVSNSPIAGLKLYPPCGYSPSDPRLYPYYEICAEHRLPVLLHTGPTSPALSFEFAAAGLIDQAAKDFPSVNFILAHAGASDVQDAIAQCMYRPNVYMDISGFPATLATRGWREHLRQLFSLDIHHKIIFGTDWPVFGSKGGLAKLVDELFDHDGPLQALPQRAVTRIMSGNIKRLLPTVQ